MKHLIAICTASLLFSTATFAQREDDEVLPKRNEVSASFGVLTTSQILELFIAATVQLGSGDNAITDVNSYSGGLFLTYRRKTMDDKFGYGVAVGYDRIAGNFRNQSGSKNGTFKATEITVAGEGQITYLNKEKMRLYGLLGLGYSRFTYEFTTNGTIDHEKVPLGHFNFQVTPIGVSFGKQVGGFVEAGLGYKGLLNFGLYVKL